MHRTHVGQLLWPVDAFTPEKIAELKRDPVTFAALYQQKPINAAGTWADPQTLQVHAKAPLSSELQFYCAMDLSTGAATSNDFTCIGVVGVDHNLDMWIVEWHRRRMELEEVVDILQDIRKQWRPNRFLIDNDLGSKYFAGMTRVESRKHSQNIVLTEVPTGGKDKETRAVNVPSMLRKGQIKTVDDHWVDALKNEIRTFPRSGAKWWDDQIDVLSILSRHHPKMAAGSAPPQARQATPPIQGAIQMINGSAHTVATLDELFEDRDNHKKLNAGRLRI